MEAHQSRKTRRKAAKKAAAAAAPPETPDSPEIKALTIGEVATGKNGEQTSSCSEIQLGKDGGTARPTDCRPSQDETTPQLPGRVATQTSLQSASSESPKIYVVIEKDRVDILDSSGTMYTPSTPSTPPTPGVATPESPGFKWGSSSATATEQQNHYAPLSPFNAGGYPFLLMPHYPYPYGYSLYAPPPFPYHHYPHPYQYGVDPYIAQRRNMQANAYAQMLAHLSQATKQPQASGKVDANLNATGAVETVGQSHNRQASELRKGTQGDSAA